MFGLLVIVTIILYINRNTRRTQLEGERRKHERELEEFIRDYGAPIPMRRYSYQEIKKMTFSFRDVLGRGGFGGVYKGKLSDGRLVAVKILNPLKRRGGEFFNEIVSISRTSHRNIVTLLGYCLDGENIALVYEFMTNGSLNKFIHHNSGNNARQQLGWEKLFQIAIEIARGLEYLHGGCKTRILHLDIKPHNILLDENFCPKISDFGLAKLCKKDESFVSMQEARGTYGYIAPEVFSGRNGVVSHKADVYSYGMTILEMAGGREKNINAGASLTSEIYYPDWIYHQLKEGENLGLGSSGEIIAEEDELAKKIIIVGLWCIQAAPAARPSIRKVIDMLEGSIEALQIPPKPLISSLLNPSSRGFSFNVAISGACSSQSYCREF